MAGWVEGGGKGGVGGGTLSISYIFSVSDGEVLGKTFIHFNKKWWLLLEILWKFGGGGIGIMVWLAIKIGALFS